MRADFLVLAKSKMTLYIEVTKKLVWSDNEDQALTLRTLITTVPAVEDYKVRYKAKSKSLPFLGKAWIIFLAIIMLMKERV